MTLTKYIPIQLLAYPVGKFFYIGLKNFFSMNPIISNIVGKITAVIFAFYLHRIFTFNVKRRIFFYHQAILYFFTFFYPSIELLFSLISKIFIDKIGCLITYNKHLHTLLFNCYKKRFLSVSIANNLTSLTLLIFWAAALLIFFGAGDFFFIISSITLLES